MAKKFCAKILPSEFKKLEDYVVKNKSILTEQIVDSISHAIEKKMTSVEVFNFRNTDYIIVVGIETFDENLKNIYDYYINTEQYEFCKRIVEVQQKLQKLINTPDSNEKCKKNEVSKRQQSKNSTKLKNKRDGTN